MTLKFHRNIFRKNSFFVKLKRLLKFLKNYFKNLQTMLGLFIFCNFPPWKLKLWNLKYEDTKLNWEKENDFAGNKIKLNLPNNSISHKIFIVIFYMLEHILIRGVLKYVVEQYFLLECTVFCLMHTKSRLRARKKKYICLYSISIQKSYFFLKRHPCIVEWFKFCWYTVCINKYSYSIPFSLIGQESFIRKLLHFLHV